jgi:ABC-type branched-subunit amino acid transport system substrate-binding protein
MVCTRTSRLGRGIGLGVTVVSMMAMAACGSGSDGGGGGGAGEATFGYVYTRVPGLDLSTTLDGLNAAAKEINDNGGVEGRTLKVVSCNDDGTADGATACVQQMVTQSAVLGVTGATLQGAVYARSLPSANVAYMPAITIGDADGGKATLAFTCTGSPFAVAAFDYLVKEFSIKKIAPIGSAAVDPNTMRDATRAAADKLGVEVAGEDLYPSAGQSDFLPIVARAVDAGVEGAYIGFLSPADYLPFLQAYRATGATFHLVTSGVSMTAEIIDGFTKAGVTLYVVSPFGPANSDGAQNKKYQEASEAAGVPVSEFGQFGYAAAEALSALLQSAGKDADRAGFYEVASAKDIDINPGPIFPGHFTRPLADLPKYAAFGNMNAVIGKYEQGVYTPVTDQPIDTAPYFQ